MELKKIALMGLGAVGSYIYWGLSRKEGIDLSVIADGERKERLEKEGIVINGVRYNPAVKTPAQARGADLLIVTVKYTALRDSLSDIKEIADSHTIIMSLMNGVDSEEIIAEAVDPGQIVYSLIKIASQRVGNSIQFDPESTIGIFYGETDPDADHLRMEALNRLFDGSAVEHQESSDIIREIWSKFLLNIGNNLPQAIIGCGVGAYDDSEHLLFIKKKLRAEVKAIAAAKGIDLTNLDQRSTKGAKVFPDARYSTLQDIDAKRHTEIDMFAGAVVKMGNELGIATPYNEAVYHLIKALEEKNDGRFDY